MSLKKILINEITNVYPRMYLFSELDGLCKRYNHKTSNAERRCRELCEAENPIIRNIKNDKGFITGYIYIPENKLPSIPAKTFNLKQQKLI